MTDASQDANRAADPDGRTIIREYMAASFETGDTAFITDIFGGPPRQRGGRPIAWRPALCRTRQRLHARLLAWLAPLPAWPAARRRRAPQPG